MTEEDFVMFVRQQAELIEILLHKDDAWAKDPAINQALRAAERTEETAERQLAYIEATAKH